jgi:hypothetical protein
MAGAQIGPRSRHCSKGRGFKPPVAKKNIKGLERNGAEKKRKEKKKTELPLIKKDSKRTKVNCL